MDASTDLKIGQNLVSLAVTLKDYIPTRGVKMDLSRCEGGCNSWAFTLPVNPIEAPGPRDNILRIKMTRLRALVGRLKPKKQRRKLG